MARELELTLEVIEASESPGSSVQSEGGAGPPGYFYVWVVKVKAWVMLWGSLVSARQALVLKMEGNMWKNITASRPIRSRRYPPKLLE